MTEQNKAFVIRMRSDARALLDAASEDQRRSRASIIEALVRQHLSQYERTEARLDKMLSGDKRA